MTDVSDELARAEQVFLDKITDQARQMSWVRAVVYSKVSKENLCCPQISNIRYLTKALANSVDSSQTAILFTIFT